MRIIAVTFYLMLGSLGVQCQSLHPILESFDFTYFDDYVRFDFSVKGGASCNGVQLQRSADSLSYEVVGEIIGVCGGSPEIEEYNLDDLSPVPNQFSYYRLILGGQGATSPLMVEFIPLKDGIVLYPNPSAGPMKIKWTNAEQVEFEIEIYGSSGRLIHNDVIGNGNEYELTESRLGKGNYLVKLRSENGRELTSRFTIID